MAEHKYRGDPPYKDLTCADHVFVSFENKRFDEHHMKRLEEEFRRAYDKVLHEMQGKSLLNSHLWLRVIP